MKNSTNNESRRAPSEDAFDYLFKIGDEKFLSEKENKYLHELFEKYDPEHLEIDEGFTHGLENIVRDDAMQNLNIYIFLAG